MANIKKQKNQVLSLVMRPGLNEFEFTDGVGDGTTYDEIDVRESLVRGAARNLSLYVKATDSPTEVLLLINPTEGVDTFAGNPKLIRIPIEADKAIQVEFLNILVDRLQIDFNGEYTEGSSNIDSIVLMAY
jgi:hypothetical protein